MSQAHQFVGLVALVGIEIGIGIGIEKTRILGDCFYSNSKF
jgi:hypothetical protein